MYTLPAGYPQDAFAVFEFLKDKKTLATEDFIVLALVESIGELFYQTLARGLDNAEARSLIERNAAEERGHAHRMLKALRLRGGGEFELPTIENNPFFALAPKEVPVSADLFGVLETAETDGTLAALEKDRKRRYETATGFAASLESTCMESIPLAHT